MHILGFNPNKLLVILPFVEIGLKFLLFRLKMIELGQTNARKHFLGLDDRLYILFAISLAEIDIIIAILLNSPQQIVLAMHLGESLKVLFILI